LVLNLNDFTFSLKLRQRWPLAANVNIYVASAHSVNNWHNCASAIAAAALANRGRHAANFLCILCLSKEGDRLSMRITAQQTHKHNRFREHSSSLQTARRARRNGMSWLPWLQ